MYRTVITSILLFSMCFHILPFVLIVEAQSTPTITSRLHVPLTAHTTLMSEAKSNTPTTKDASLLVKDYLSSTRAVVENQPSIISHSYYPYGSPISSEVPTVGSDDQGPTDSPQGVLSTDSDQRERTDRLFTGHRKLDDLTVYHAGARFYTPNLGLFIQPDRVEGPHRYAYVGNNSITFVDPSGKIRIDATVVSENEEDLPGIELQITQASNDAYTPIQATGIYDPDVIDRELMTDDQLFALQALTFSMVAAPVLVEGGVAMAGSAVLGKASSVVTGAAVRRAATAAVGNFTTGGVLSGGFEFLAQASEGQWDVGGIARMSGYGGLSQAVSFGLMGPQSLGALRPVKAMVQRFPRMASSRMGRAASWTPALLSDAAIWTPGEYDAELDDGYADVFRYQLGLQTTLQGALGVADMAGERTFNRQALGSRAFMGVFAGGMALGAIKNQFQKEQKPQ